MKRNQQLWGARPCGRAHYCGYISWGVDGVTRGAESSGRGAQASKTFFFFPSVAGFAVFDRGFCFLFARREEKRRKKKRFPRRGGLLPPVDKYAGGCHSVPRLADSLFKLRPANVFHPE